MIRDLRKMTACWNEYDTLHQVVLCPPRYLRIDEVINEVQSKYKEEGIDEERALKQHQHLLSTLKEGGVDVLLLEPSADYPDQVFTRDIGFTLGSQLFISQMEEDIRKGEVQEFMQWLNRSQIPFHLIHSGSIEGGDVLIDRDIVWVGDSGRTSQAAIQELHEAMPTMEVISLPFPDQYLHLDCVFNILSSEDALIYSPAFQPEDRARLAARYRLIEVEREEQFTMGVNVLSIGHKRVLSLPCNKKVNQAMQERGYTVIEVDISEIIKSGGSFRCSTLPLLRTP